MMPMMMVYSSGGGDDSSRGGGDDALSLTIAVRFCGYEHFLMFRLIVLTLALFAYSF